MPFEHGIALTRQFRQDIPGQVVEVARFTKEIGLVSGHHIKQDRQLISGLAFGNDHEFIVLFIRTKAKLYDSLPEPS